MPSRIDPSKPPDHDLARKADVRQNFAAARSELEHGGFFKRHAAHALERPTTEALAEIHISAPDFGAKGDGATDNAEALIAMRDLMRHDTSRLYRIFFPPGKYDYSNNRWLWGVPSFILDAYGASFRCVAEDSWDENTRALNLRDPFNTTGDAPAGPANTFTSGDRFATAFAGDDSITLLDPAAAAVYAPGARVLLHGYDQQFGHYPPNPRYFEYKIVAAVDGAEVAFTEPLDFAYDGRWPEGGITEFFGAPLIWGKPRILRLERPDYLHPRFVWIRGATFLANPNSNPNSSLAQAPGDLVIYEDVASGYLAPSYSDQTEVRRSRVRDFEGDKLLGSLLVEGCEVDGSFTEATGAHRLVVRDSRMRGDIRPRARHMRLTDCDLYGPPTQDWGIYRHLGGFVSTTLMVDGCRFYSRARGLPLRHAINSGEAHAVTVVAAGDGGAIRVPWDEAARLTASMLDVGHTLAVRNGSNSGRITAIYHDGGVPGHLVIEGTWKRVPRAGEVYLARYIEIMVDGGGNVVIGRHAPLWREPLLVHSGGDSGTRIVTLPTREINWRGDHRFLLCTGHVRRLRVSVVEPYTGADPEPLLRVQLWDGTEEAEVAVIDLRTTAFRELTPFSANGAAGRDVLAPEKLLRYAHEVRLLMRQGGSPISGADHEMPRGGITLEIEPSAD